MMNKPELFIKSTCLATQEKLDGKELACGKLQSNSSPANFLFYLLELNQSYPNSKVLKKTIQILENNFKTLGDEITDESFENILGSLNEALSRLAESGENNWLGNLNAIIGLVNKKEILISQTGNTTGYIFRKNKISSIVESNNTETNFHPLKTFTEITAGQIAPSDHLVFGNLNLFNRISLDRIRTISKGERFDKAVTELYRYLKKNKVKDVNAIFIMASEEEPNNDEESLDVLYLDLPDETVKKFVEKHISPSVIASKKFLAKYLPICIQFCREKIAKGKKSWQENLGPRSKKIIHSGAQSFSNQISKINKKVPNLVGPKANNNLAKIKIKTNSYLNPKNKNKLSPVLLTIWGVVKNLRFLFIKTNRRYLYGILILLFLSVGYTKLKYNNDKRSQKTKEIQLLNSFDKADQDFRKVKEDLALGKTVSNEKVYEVLATAEKSKEIPANQEKAESLIKEINSLLDERTKTIRLYSDKSANFAENLVSIVLSGNSIYGINREGKIYNLDTREKEGKLIASLDKSNGEPVALTVAEQKSSIILSTAKNLLFSMNLQSKTIEELKINSDPNTNTWSSSKSLATYSSNIYLLSSENGVVWKHSLKDSGYTKGTSYLDTKKISIRGAVDFAVDGNIYVLSNEGTVLKFVKGTLEPDFNIKDIPGPHNQILVPKRIFTEEDTNSIFVLDKKYERIIKFDKSGDFSTQYVLDGKPIDDFVVNAKLQKIWILSQGKIYEGNL